MRIAQAFHLPTFLLGAALIGLAVPQGSPAAAPPTRSVHYCALPCWHKMRNAAPEWYATDWRVQTRVSADRIRRDGRFAVTLCNYTDEPRGFEPVPGQMRLRGLWFDSGQYLGIASDATTLVRVGPGNCARATSAWRNLSIAAGPVVQVSNGGVWIKAGGVHHP